MKKRIVFGIFIFLIYSKSFCQVNFISPEDTKIVIKQSVQYNFLPDFKNDTTGFSTSAFLDMNELRLDLGLSETGEKVNITFRGIYWPSFYSKKINLGIGLLYHIYVYPFEFTENDFKAGLYFKIKFAKKFAFMMDVNYYAKLSVFNLNIPSLLNQTVNIDLIFFMQTNEKLKIYGGMLSNTFYDYPLSFEPNFMIGIENYFSEHFMLGAEFYIDWIDLICSVANIHQVNLKLYAGYKI